MFYPLPREKVLRFSSMTIQAQDALYEPLFQILLLLPILSNLNRQYCLYLSSLHKHLNI